MFSKSAQYYDEIYGSMGKDYAAESGKIHRLVEKYGKTEGKLLLDVACGTGIHAGHLSRYYKVEGLDLDRQMLSVAHKRQPMIQFHQGDMTDFDLGREFDIVTCLFSSIGYARTKSKMYKAIKNMSRHLLPGGILLIEPWFTPEQWNRGRVSILQVDKPELKIIRMSHSGQRRNISLIEFQYLIGTPKGIEHYTEIHELGLFSHEEYLGAFAATGLKVAYEKKGLDGRGLYIGLKQTGRS